MELKNTQTEKNIRAALAGESIARNRYTYFAEAARKNGDEDVAVAFEQMSINEMTHAKLLYELLNGKPGTTKSCLQSSAAGEYSEWHRMYPEFAAQARADGLEEIATMFEHIANIEKSHENRFMTLLAKLQKKDSSTTSNSPENDILAKKTKKSGYRCQFCGALFGNRPDVCNVCDAIGAFDLVEYYE